MITKKILYACLGLLLASFSCSENTRTVEDITLTAEVSALDGRLTTQLSVITTPPGIANPGLVWSSSDPSMATVDNSGLVTAVRKGTVTLTAALQNDPDTKGTLDLDITQNDFVTTWKGKQITIPTNTKFEYDYNVDWDNDGHFDSTSLTGSTDHTFENGGEHTIRISGAFPAVQFYRDQDVITDPEKKNAARILFVDQWGSEEWVDLDSAFYFCENLDVRATDSPNLSKVEFTAFMFAGTGLTDPDFSQWDTSNITYMTGMFQDATTANPNVSGWNTSKVAEMEKMFQRATNADPDVSQWNISSITSSVGMQNIFQGSALSRDNYDKALERFAAHATTEGLNLPQNINLGNVPASFCEAKAARNVLTDNGWIINDNGEDCPEGL